MTAQRVRAEEGRGESLTKLADLEERLRVAETDGSAPGHGAESTAADREMAAASLAEVRIVEMDARLAVRTAEERAESVRGKADSLRRAAAAEREARIRAERALRARAHAAEVAAAVAESGQRVAAELETVVAAALAHRDELARARSECTAKLDQVRETVRALTGQLASLTDAVHRDEVAKAQAALRIEQLEESILDQYGIGPRRSDRRVRARGRTARRPLSKSRSTSRPRSVGSRSPPPLRFRTTARLRNGAPSGPRRTSPPSARSIRWRSKNSQLSRSGTPSSPLSSRTSRPHARTFLLWSQTLDARILQVFTEAYADVEREFVGVFEKLFPGGEGRLVLTDPSDMLTTGIEVEARPPGKKVKRLSLLSGGEKSLTAVAMLVAIFRARPSPFYVMDEVEAALDDTNLRRLIGLFEQLREKSQLIVITHQKPTMEIADALYGVSMRGDGITTVISQRLRGQDMAST